MRWRGALAAAAVLALAACDAAPPPREEVPKLAVDAGWPTIPAGAKFGEVSAVDVDPAGNVWVLHRAGRKWEEPFPKAPIADPTVFKFSPDGRLIARWGAGQFVIPHGISIAPDGKVWITDVAREQVMRFLYFRDLRKAAGVEHRRALLLGGVPQRDHRVEAAHRVAGGDQVRRHRAAHVAQADEGDALRAHGCVSS